MDITAWEQRLNDLKLGDIYVYQQVDSTNQVAEQLIKENAPEFSLVVADEQTAGRGRHGRSWITRKGIALAFSWILYPNPAWITPESVGKLSGLGALAVAEVLKDQYQFETSIKWPNDVLVQGKKVCGVLVDIQWSGSMIKNAILGIGLNVLQGSVSDQDNLRFPASSLQELTGSDISRLDLLVQILESLLKWYPKLNSKAFIKSWQDNLAYMNQAVTLEVDDEVLDRGLLYGISDEGLLILLSDSGSKRLYRTGEIQLRLVDRS
jgi:BirA family biotin operon repressor/biotin-[acetyl-CoA-carboxylase] ligase